MVRHLLCIVVFVIPFQLCSQTGIGTTTPHASAKLEVNATDKGFLPPRMTSTQRSAISNPATGLMVYQTDGTSGLYYYSGTDWIYIINSTTNIVSITNGGTGTNTATGTGSVVLSNSPSLITPTLGIASGTSLAITGTTSSTSTTTGSLTVAGGVGIGGTLNAISIASSSLVVPLISGGSGTTQSLSYRPTSGNGTTGADHIFQVGNNGGTEAMRILNNGNVGIGTSSPSAKLNIAGGGIRIHNGFTRSSSRPSLTTSTIGNYEIRGVGTILGSTQRDDGDDGFLRFSAGGGSALTAQSSIDISGGSDNSDMDRNIVMRTAGTERFRINSIGNIGIGSNDPTSRLDVVGDVKISGALNVSGSSNVNFQTPALQVGAGSADEGGEIQFALAQTNQSLNGRVIVDVYRNQLRFLESGGNARGVNIDLSKAPSGASGELIWKRSDFVDAGTFVTLDNLRATVTTAGNRGLSLSTVSGSIAGYISGSYTLMVGGIAGTAGSASISTSASASIFGWGFTAQGDTATYILRDDTNARVYRIIMIIGGSYLANFISIERLH